MSMKAFYGTASSIIVVCTLPEFKFELQLAQPFALKILPNTFILASKNFFIFLIYELYAIPLVLQSNCIVGLLPHKMPGCRVVALSWVRTNCHEQRRAERLETGMHSSLR